MMKDEEAISKAASSVEVIGEWLVEMSQVYVEQVRSLD